MQVTFGEWLPDLPPQANPGLVTAKNCLPYATHYEGLPSVVNYTATPLAQRCRGFIYAKDNTGNAYSFAGDISDLYKLSGVTWTVASRTADYSTANADNWEFAQWGETVVATNYTDDVQTIALTGSNFAALSGSPPKARHLAVVRDFMVLGNCLDYSSGASVPNRVHWSAFNDNTSWTPAAATQCDFQDLYGEAGWIQRVIGGEFGLIFQERAITKMTYIGSPWIFQFDRIVSNQGTPCPNSVIQHGTNVYFLGQDDFYLFNGVGIQGIGGNRVYNTFIADYDPSYYYRVSAAVDPINPFIIWAYPSKTATGGNPDKLLIYNYQSQKWAFAEINVEILCTQQQAGYTLDGLDALSATYATLDLLPESLDSRIWMGGALNMGAFNTDHNLASFTGNDMTAVFETGERQLIPGKRALITNTRPSVDGISASVSVAISSRNRAKDAVTTSSPVVVNSEGEAPIMNEARYHRFKVTVADNFDKALGLEVEASPGGQY